MTTQVAKPVVVETEPVIGETKPGYKTTEFYLTVATAIGILATALASALPARWAAIATAVSIAAYAISRGQAKQGVPYHPTTTVVK